MCKKPQRKGARFSDCIIYMFSLFYNISKNSLKIYTFFIPIQTKEFQLAISFYYYFFVLHFNLQLCNYSSWAGYVFFWLYYVLCFNLDVLVKIFIWSGISLTLLLLFLCCHRCRAAAELQNK